MAASGAVTHCKYVCALDVSYRKNLTFDLSAIITINMIIVFFHVLYLIGKMVYNNYYSGKPNDNDKMDEKSLEPVNRWKRHDPETAYADENEDNNRPKAPRFSPPVYIQRYVAVQKVLVDPRYKDKLKKVQFVISLLLLVLLVTPNNHTKICYLFSLCQVVDFGCSELSFLVHLKNTPCIEEILCIDIDRETLEANRHKAIPLNADYLHSRTRPLTIHVCEGSVTHNDKKLANVDAVVAIEL